MSKHEVGTLAELQEHLDVLDLHEVIVQGLSLYGVADTLRRCRVEGAVFIGCALAADAAADLVARGALVFPTLPDLPYQVGRSALYTVDELMEGYVRGSHHSFFAGSTDGAIYAHYDAHRKERVPFLEALAQRLHDHAIEDALEDLLHPPGQPARRVVAFMGGHATPRTHQSFTDVARCARALAREGYLIATGGGPGSMEAANLGAACKDATEGDLKEAIGHLQAAPSYKDEGWFDRAYEVRDGLAAKGLALGETLGIPTWFYGHEPSNLFCSHIAKFFSNALREDGLLAIARHGVVFGEGGPGTVQEIFMDACQNAYGTFGDVSPMVFLGQRYWHEVRPAMPLLRSLSKGRQLDALIGVFDDVEHVVAFLKANPPVDHVK
jgi:predicted Rossmann-fold nucleotide-binding protein